MLIELRDVEVYVEPDDILYKALQDGDLSIQDAIRICEEEAGSREVLDSIDDEDIQIYCNDKSIELEINLEMMVDNLKNLSHEERASLLWYIIGASEEEIKHLVTVEIVIPKLNELIKSKGA